MDYQRICKKYGLSNIDIPKMIVYSVDTEVDYAVK